MNFSAVATPCRGDFQHCLLRRIRRITIAGEVKRHSTDSRRAGRNLRRYSRRESSTATNPIAPKRDRAGGIAERDGRGPGIDACP